MITLTEVKPNGVTLTNPKILYREEQHGYRGCDYTLCRYPEHTDQDIENAKKWIKYHLDSLRITVVNIKEYDNLR